MEKLDLVSESNKTIHPVHYSPYVIFVHRWQVILHQKFGYGNITEINIRDITVLFQDPVSGKNYTKILVHNRTKENIHSLIMRRVDGIST